MYILKYRHLNYRAAIRLQKLGGRGGKKSESHHVTCFRVKSHGNAARFPRASLITPPRTKTILACFYRQKDKVRQ